MIIEGNRKLAPKGASSNQESSHFNICTFRKPSSDLPSLVCVKATSHSTIFDIPMRPVREGQRHRGRFTSVKDCPQFPWW